MIFNVEFAQGQVVIQWVIDLEIQVKELKLHNEIVHQQVNALNVTIHELEENLKVMYF